MPILVKLIDAKTDLSVQVHPDDAYAKAVEGGQNGKSEMWYVVDAEPGADEPGRSYRVTGQMYRMAAYRSGRYGLQVHLPDRHDPPSEKQGPAKRRRVRPARRAPVEHHRVLPDVFAALVEARP